MNKITYNFDNFFRTRFLLPREIGFLIRGTYFFDDAQTENLGAFIANNGGAQQISFFQALPESELQDIPSWNKLYFTGLKEKVLINNNDVVGTIFYTFNPSLQGNLNELINDLNRFSLKLVIAANMEFKVFNPSQTETQTYNIQIRQLRDGATVHTYVANSINKINMTEPEIITLSLSKDISDYQPNDIFIAEMLMLEDIAGSYIRTTNSINSAFAVGVVSNDNWPRESGSIFYRTDGRAPSKLQFDAQYGETGELAGAKITKVILNPGFTQNPEFNPVLDYYIMNKVRLVAPYQTNIQTGQTYFEPYFSMLPEITPKLIEDMRVNNLFSFVSYSSTFIIDFNADRIQDGTVRFFVRMIKNNEIIAEQTTTNTNGPWSVGLSASLSYRTTPGPIEIQYGIEPETGTPKLKTPNIAISISQSSTTNPTNNLQISFLRGDSSTLIFWAPEGYLLSRAYQSIQNLGPVALPYSVANIPGVNADPYGIATKDGSSGPFVWFTVTTNLKNFLNAEGKDMFFDIETSYLYMDDSNSTPSTKYISYTVKLYRNNQMVKNYEQLDFSTPGNTILLEKIKSSILIPNTDVRVGDVIKIESLGNGKTYGWGKYNQAGFFSNPDGSILVSPVDSAIPVSTKLYRKDLKVEEIEVEEGVDVV